MLDLLPLAALPSLPTLEMAVVGHVEVATFLRVEDLPAAGEIAHARDWFDSAAGGGAVVAAQMARLTGPPVEFFTALGKDDVGEKALAELRALGLHVHVAWRDAPTRRAVTFLDSRGERTITVIGERLAPCAADPLPWERLARCDGVFVTATDPDGLLRAREARILAATPRVRLPVLRQAAVVLEALIGSASDPGEAYHRGDLVPHPRLYVGTLGQDGGLLEPGGRFAALPRSSPVRDTYGAGDAFAAGFTVGLAAEWDLAATVSLGCHCGNAALDGWGPYRGQLGRERLARSLS